MGSIATFSAEAATRPLNAVDLLQKRIVRIQEVCAHHFELVAPFVPEATKHKHIFGAGKISETSYTGGYSFSTRCVRCSAGKTHFLVEVCPLCLSVMEKEFTDNPEKYFDSDELSYHRAVIFKCTGLASCNFRVVGLQYDR